MHMRRTIGISLALMVISTGVPAQEPDKSASHHPGQSDGTKPQKAALRTGKPQALSSRGGRSRTVTRHAAHHSAPARHAPGISAETADAGRGPPDAYLASTSDFGGRQIGRAAWYNLVGGYTSTGERLDTITATAAHRTLPLSSYARVTNLDSGRSVIVKINDRGPWTRRFIIDLSPRAADILGMRQAGVAQVMVEPVSPSMRAASTLATYRSSGALLMQ
jgi:rare lipoprotein A